MSALVGAIFLTWADVLARVVVAPEELPIGIVTAFAGAPCFLWLMRSRRRTEWTREARSSRCVMVGRERPHPDRRVARVRVQGTFVGARRARTAAASRVCCDASTACIRPDTGLVSVDGRGVWDLTASDVAREVGVVLQERPSETAFTVREMVLMGRGPHKRLLERDTSRGSSDRRFSASRASASQRSASARSTPCPAAKSSA